MASTEPKLDFLDPPSQPGDLGTLSHYRVINELGRGGMGYVFRAQDKRLQREVAMKVMNDKFASTPYSRRRFIHEARAMAAVHHDNVATIFEVGEKSGTPFMAMEMLKGATLERFNQGDQRLGYEEIIRYATQIARGLAAAHAKGIVHRDIKPANLWIDSEKDRIKILDFGLALAATPVDQLAGRGAVIGTPGYLSPEQARTEPLDDRSDLYSLGVVLYELCTGRLPLQASTVAGQLIAILAHRPQPIVEINPEIPSPLANLVHRLLCKEPRARIRSAALLEQELARVEVECHAKSEVAQTISKLQQGLESVVSRKAAAVFTEPAETVEALDPFAALPDIPLAATATPAVPLAAVPLAAVPYADSRIRKAPPPPSVNWQRYLPFAAIAGVGLIVLPIVIYAMSGGERNEAAIAVAQQSSPDGAKDDSSSATKNSQQERDAKGAGNQQGGNANGQNQRKQPNTGKGAGKNNAQGKKNAQGTNAQARANAQAKANGQAKANAQRKNAQPNSGVPAQKSSKNNAQRNRPETVNLNAKTRAGSPNQANQSTDSGNDNRDEERTPGTSVSSSNTNVADRERIQNPMSAPASIAASAAVPSAPARDMQRSKISTAQGRGADTMVQIGTTANQGLKPSIGIHKRGAIESHHSYVRFDLASIEEVRDELASAELVLTMVGRNRPVGATVRVYGIVSGGQPLWQEDGPLSLVWANTPSSVGFQSQPLLGTATVSDQIDPRDDSNNAIRISSPELAAFIRDTDGDTITLALAGDSNSRTPLRFVSREGSSTEAPRLEIEAPKEKLPNKGGNARRSRGQR